MGKSAVVTGSARGIGRAIAERLAKDGMWVIVADIDGDEARATAEAIGDSARACRVDVSDDDSIAELIEAAHSLNGGIDVMVCCAGIMDRMPFLEMDKALWNRILSIITLKL